MGRETGWGPGVACWLAASRYAGPSLRSCPATRRAGGDTSGGASTPDGPSGGRVGRASGARPGVSRPGGPRSRLAGLGVACRLAASRYAGPSLALVPGYSTSGGSLPVVRVPGWPVRWSSSAGRAERDRAYRGPVSREAASGLGVACWLAASRYAESPSLRSCPATRRAGGPRCARARLLDERVGPRVALVPGYSTSGRPSVALVPGCSTSGWLPVALVPGCSTRADPRRGHPLAGSRVPRQIIVEALSRTTRRICSISSKWDWSQIRGGESWMTGSPRSSARQ